MTIKYTVYDSNSGVILRTGETMTMAQAQLQGNTPGTYVVTEGADPVTQYVDPGSGTTQYKAPMSAGGTLTAADKTNFSADGVDIVTIDHIPAGASCTVVVPPDQGVNTVADFSINDGYLQITTTAKGTYRVTLRFSNYLDFVVTLNAA